MACALAAAAPAAASASDATLRAAIVQYGTAYQRDAVPFVREVKRLPTATDVRPLRVTIAKLVVDVQQMHGAVKNQHASTAHAAKGRLLLLGGLTQLRRGLQSYDRAIANLGEGKVSHIKRTLAKALAQIRGASKTDTAAEKLIVG